MPASAAEIICRERAGNDPNGKLVKFEAVLVTLASARGTVGTGSVRSAMIMATPGCAVWLAVADVALVVLVTRASPRPDWLVQSKLTPVAPVEPRSWKSTDSEPSDGSYSKGRCSSQNRSNWIRSGLAGDGPATRMPSNTTTASAPMSLANVVLIVLAVSDVVDRVMRTS
jgi:hypothetical protein